MTSITFSFFGPPEQKHVCKITAMQTLSDALQAVSTKFKPALKPDQCELVLNKKPVDLRTPFRLLNVPAGSKLEIIKKDTPGAAPAAASSAPAAQASAMPGTAAAQVAAPAQATAPAPAATPEPAAPAPAAPAAPAAESSPAVPRQVAFAQQAAAAPAAAAAPSTSTPAAPSAVEAPSSTAAAGDGAASSAAAVRSPLAVLGVQVPVYVFHQKVLEAAAAQAPSAMDIDPPDEFFELTADDLARLQQQANAKKKAESVFRTRAAREADEAVRARHMGPVPVRLHFPDGTLLQANFRATDQLAAVQELVCKCAEPQVAPGLYLYTTPPKTLLKDLTATLYNLQLVPAAHIFVGLNEQKLQGSKAGTVSAAGAAADAAGAGSFLRPEVLAQMQDTVPEQASTEQQKQQQGQDAGGGSSSSRDDQAAVAEAQRALRVAAAASRQEGGGGTAGAGGKVPKWLKMGKK